MNITPMFDEFVTWSGLTSLYYVKTGLLISGTWSGDFLAGLCTIGREIF